MLTKQLLKRAFAVHSMAQTFKPLLFIVSPKFPEGTVAGVYKRAMAQNEYYDAARFGTQKLNWTLREFDRYSSAFANGLVESGFEKGDKLLLWVDQTNSAEVLVAQIGALKAGVTVVTFDEKDNLDALNSALKDSSAKGFMLSPQTVISQEENGHQTTRQTFLQKLMPELHALYPGDELSLKSFPHLKQIIQLGHTTIRGVIKFKDSMVYSTPKMSTIQLPENSPQDMAFQSYVNGKVASQFTQAEILDQSNSLWSNHIAKYEQADKPVFISLNLETPLAVAAFIASNTNQQKVYIPSTFNVNTILQSLKTQHSRVVICDQELYQLAPPKGRVDEFLDMTSSVEKVVIGGTQKAAGQSPLFKGETTVIDPYRLN